MKVRKFFVIWLLILEWGTIRSQIETTAAFPRIGDTLQIIRTQLKVVPGEPKSGPDNFWNFLFLDAPYVEDLVFISPSLGSAKDFFPQSDVMALTQGGAESYFRFTRNGIVEEGRFGSQDWLKGDNFVIQYETAPVVKKFKQKLNSTYTDFSTFSVDLTLAKLADYGIDVMALRSEKVKVQFDINKRINFDASGKLLLPFGSYDVLRAKEEVTIRIELLTPSGIGWEALSPSFYTVRDPILPIGEHKLTHYHFYTNQHDFPILSIQQKTSGPFEVVYINEDPSTKLPKISSKKKDVIAYPNPTFGEITFNLINYPSGNYRLTVSDIVNKPIFTEEYYVRGNGKLNADLSFLQHGHYLYSIYDASGNKLTTKRVVILRP